MTESSHDLDRAAEPNTVAATAKVSKSCGSKTNENYTTFSNTEEYQVPATNEEQAQLSNAEDERPQHSLTLKKMHPTQDAQRADTSATKAAHPHAGWSRPDILRERAENANGTRYPQQGPRRQVNEQASLTTTWSRQEAPNGHGKPPPQHPQDHPPSARKGGMKTVQRRTVTVSDVSYATATESKIVLRQPSATFQAMKTCVRVQHTLRHWQPCITFSTLKTCAKARPPSQHFRQPDTTFHMMMKPCAKARHTRRHRRRCTSHSALRTQRPSTPPPLKPEDAKLQIRFFFYGSNNTNSRKQT